jgi:AcrR family transcriptional regulator
MRAFPDSDSRRPPGRPALAGRNSPLEQRRRILRAAADLVAEQGYRRTSTEQIVRRGHVGYVTFYNHFASKEACFMTLFNGTIDLAAKAIAEAFAAGPPRGPWADRVAASLRVLCELIVSDPPLARACVVEAPAAGDAVLSRYREEIARAGKALQLGAQHATVEPLTFDRFGELIAGGLFYLAHRHLAHGEAARLPALLPAAVEYTLTPYLGEDQALRISRQVEPLSAADL